MKAWIGGKLLGTRIMTQKHDSMDSWQTRNKNQTKYLVTNSETTRVKVEKVLKGSLNWIPSPSPSVKIQIRDHPFKT